MKKVYAIGDIQGCLDEFKCLLDVLNFDPSTEQIWLAGDLVNRGRQSLETLRFVKSLGNAAVCVLGNHDLHLLALANRHPLFDLQKSPLAVILDAPDASELINWLRMRKILHYDLGFFLVHAGIYPFWGDKLAIEMAAKLEQTLASDNYSDFILEMYGNTDRWQVDMPAIDELRFAVNSFTRMRFLYPDGRLNFTEKGGENSCQLTPWFAQNTHRRVIFGHWSTLNQVAVNRTYAIDTSCVWGGDLSALSIPSNANALKQFDVQNLHLTQISCTAYQKNAQLNYT